MKPEEQNSAIAEACGWKPRHHAKGFYRSEDEPYIECLPDYCNDLNAMHEAEKILTGDQQHDYESYLLHMDYPQWEIKVTHATAAQRAEAFLKTLSLWKPC